MCGNKLLAILETELETPKPYGFFHLSWLLVTIAVIILLFIIRKRNTERQLKCILGVYSIIALVLEVLKQIIWAVEYNNVTNTFVWDYQWYAFPFQLCTMPIYICLICLFLKKNWLRDSLLAFVAYTTILGSIASAIIPDALFVSDVLVNVHAMWLHLGSLVVSVYLLMSKEVAINRNSLLSAVAVFLAAVIVASILNISIYNSGILNEETFNMFYISPYFDSTLPVFDVIYKSVPYPVFLITYIFALSLGSYIIFIIAKVIEITTNHKKRVEKNIKMKVG